MTEKPTFCADPPRPSVEGAAVERDVLSDLLDAVGLRGERLSRHAAAGPEELAVAARGPVMHLVDRGGLRIALAGHDRRIELGAGDCVLLPHGDAHTVVATTDTAAGPGGARWLTGTLAVDAALADRLLDSLPPAIVLPASGDPRYRWLGLSAGLLTEELTTPRPGGAVMVSRILDLLFIQAIRAWAADTPDRSGWLVAVMDPAIGRALTAIHRAPRHPWTVTELAAVATVSRSAFAERFTTLVGEPPGRYLTGRRLAVAADLLRRDTAPVAEVAAAVGYASESAFSRAFRRRYATSPLRWRRDG